MALQKVFGVVRARLGGVAALVLFTCTGVAAEPVEPVVKRLLPETVIAAATKAAVDAGPVGPYPVPSTAAAEETEAAAGPEEGGDLAAPASSWDGVKARLAARGVEIGGSYISDVSRVPGTRQAITRGLSTVSAGVDLEKVSPRLKGTSVFVSHLWKGGSDGTARIPMMQAFSNIDNFNFQKLYEAFVETRFERVPVRVKVGQVDANTEFAVVDGGLDFVNSSMGFSPTIFLLPTYPNPTPSVNVFVDPVSHLNVGVGVYSQLEGSNRWKHPFVIGQVTGGWSLGEGFDGYLRVGGWRQGVEDETGFATAHGGVFAVAEQTVWQSAPGQEGTRSLKLFGQYGSSQSVLTPVSRHIGGGASWTGLLKARAADVFGVGFTAARLGLGSDFAGSTELAVGPYYRLAIAGRFQVGPDLQFVRHPGGDPAASTQTVFTLRMMAEF